jgi:hypothetical protein
LPIALEAARRNLGLQSQDVALLHSGAREGLIVEQLPATGSMVEFVAQELAIGAVFGEVHSADQHSNHATDFGIGRELDLLLLVSGRVPNLDGDRAHFDSRPGAQIEES